MGECDNGQYYASGCHNAHLHLWRQHQRLHCHVPHLPACLRVTPVTLSPCEHHILQDAINTDQSCRSPGIVLGRKLLSVGSGSELCVHPMMSRFGVGGEYPMAAGSAAERAEAGGHERAKKRGREVRLLRMLGPLSACRLLTLEWCRWQWPYRTLLPRKGITASM